MNHTLQIPPATAEGVATSKRPPAWRVWLQASRPKTLWASVAPVLIGTSLAYADNSFRPAWAALALLFALLMQIGANFCNDLVDFKKGADTNERVGPLRVTQAGWVTPRGMAWATALVFGAGLAVGLALALRIHWSLAGLVLLCVVCGAAYTAGPASLGYLGLGDLFVFPFFGPIAVTGTYCVQTLDWNPVVVAHGIPPGLLSVAILAVNNLRDIETDARAGKRTLAVRFGADFVRKEYLFCLLGAAAVPPILFLGAAEGPWTLLALGFLPLAAGPLRKIWGPGSGPALNPVLGATARLMLVYAALMSLGLALSH